MYHLVMVVGSLQGWEAPFFAYHVLWPQGLSGPFEWFSALIGMAAFIALFRYQLGIIPVIAGCGGLGLVYS
jgi:chromate transporter